MEETAFIEKLGHFGLGRQEAVIYLCLLKNGELTGYEVSKLTGISRSNVYNGLAALVEHGGAYVLEGASNKYIAVKLEELCDNRIRALKKEEAELLRNAPQQEPFSEGYITIAGYSHICDKIHHMLMGAQQRVYFAADSDFLERWSSEIQELLQRGIKVVLISKNIPECFIRQKQNSTFIFYQSTLREREWEEAQVRLIIDSAYVLTGQAAGNSADTCLYSAQRNFVNVFKEAMSNEIKLIEIAKENAGEGR